MKQFYFFIIFFISYCSYSQSFADTKGELQITASGAATYNLPIATPPSIKNVAPIINLTYSSGVKGGIAGQGWNISTISTISRIATRRDIDGFVDGVDFDDNDKLALDGQRLLVKTGTYWASGSTYETEYKSNTRIELKTEGTTIYFVVTSPDGSRSWYGSAGSGNLQNSVSVNSWYIVRYEDTYGNFIHYNYKNVAYNSTNQLYIDNIVFSGNTIVGIAAQNKISFNYKNLKRVERDYINGGAVYATQILDNVQVFAENTLFRTYKLTHTEDTSLGYERLTSIQEINAQMEASNPLVFDYESSPSLSQRTEKKYTNILNFDRVRVAGDFDGDGRLDFVQANKIYTNLFNADSGNEPITLPFIYGTEKLMAATTLTDNKVNQFQSLVRVIEKLDGINFEFYNPKNGGFPYAFTKTMAIENRRVIDRCPNIDPEDDEIKENQYLEGDFNGDGISEIFMMSSINERKKVTIAGEDLSKPKCLYDLVNSGYAYYILDLNPSASATLGSKGFVKLGGTINSPLYNLDNPFTYKNIIGDFNGDGKSDILSITQGTNVYQIVTFKQLNAAPWIQMEVIGSGVLDKYIASKQLLVGDFNGDGKTDIMLPDTLGGSGHTTWHIYYSNPNPAGGNFFVKETHNIVEYWPVSNNDDFKTQQHFSSYYAMDINKDGKSDVVRVWRKYYKPGWTINDHNTQWQITGFKNNIGKLNASGFQLEYDSGVFDSGSPDIPIPLTSNYRYEGANTDLVLIRGFEKNIEYYQFNKNVNTENRLKSVTESNGNVKQIIEYKPMAAGDYSFGNPSTDFYSSGNAVTYPNIEIVRNTDNYLVSKLTATINNVSKYQSFKYRGYVANFDYGTVGFTRTARSSWYLSDSDAKIWTTQHNDVALKGANTITWTSTNGNTVFDSTPSNLISTKTNIFESNAELIQLPTNNYPNDITITNMVIASNDYIANNSITASSAFANDRNLKVNYQAPQVVLKPGFSFKPNNTLSNFRAFAATPEGGGNLSKSGIYNILLNKQITVDHIGNTRTETTFTYDGTVQSPSYFGLETKTVTKRFSGNTLQGTSTVDTQYDNNETGAGSAYYVGRPKKINSSTNVYTGDTRTSELVYTYSGTNLSRTEKKGNNTYAIVEDMTYDALGNLLTKTVSAPQATTPAVPRTITDQYDSTKRFVVKKTDHQGFVNTFGYNSLGQLKQSTDYLGVSKSFTYDNWGKLTNTTTQNVSATPLTSTIVYAKTSDGGYTATATDNTDSRIVTKYDVLGRVVLTTTKGYAVGSQVSKQIVYDGLGRKTKESEPYFSSPGQWTEYEYDYLMRPTKVKAHTGKIQTLEYNGLTTTSSDDGKITTATVDALGNKTQTTDPGGTVSFVYYADGQLKESNYQDNKVVISIDGWGNKIAMTDPSAGTYTYSYDAFGQIKTETTPNGTTAYVYDDAGRATEKTIVGTNTNSKTTYVYNTTNNLLTSSSFVNTLEGTTTTSTFEYDTYKRITKTVEATPYAVFTKELAYDTYGRALTETSTAVISATQKSSIKKVKHTYQNGFPWQILDDATQQVLWQTNTLNERGQLTSATLGNGITATHIYDQYGYASQFRFDKTGPNPTNIMTLVTSFEPKRGNLTNRINNLFSWNENFAYDELDRLLTYNNELGEQQTQSYDAKGKITQNNIGTYNYTVSGKTYQNNSITLTPAALSYYQNRSSGTAAPTNANGTEQTASTVGLEVTYNTFKSPVTIKEKGADNNYIDYLSFTYNDGNERSTMFYGGVQEDKLLRPLRKHYSADGTMEIKEDRISGALEFVTYIGGDAYSAPLVVKSDGTVQNNLYLHRDYQGTILAVTDNAGAIVEKRLFDAWGAILKVQNGSGGTLAGLTVLDRGYTGHEHLQSVNIIHMNGRLYDPKLHRFMQPDNFIQDPTNTQNHNRYGYVLNNPLKYTDPSGEEIVIGTAIAIGAAVAALTYTVTALVADVPFSVGGLVKATFIGAASSAVTFGIGSAAGTITNFYVRTVVSAVAHGTFQGGVTAISGGKFWSGFAAGALSSIAASAWSGGSNLDVDGQPIAGTGMKGIGGSFANSGLGMISFGTVSGGVGAALTGGNFWQGAVTGLVVSGLNHAAHMMGDNDNMLSDDDQQQQGKQVTRKSLGISSKDTREVMISKVLKNMKVGDYITGDEASFLGDASKSYIKTVTRTGTSTFSVDGKSSWAISIFKSGATISISQQIIRGNTSAYKVIINGLTGAAKTFNVPSTSYIDGNITYVTENNKWFTIN